MGASLLAVAKSIYYLSQPEVNMEEVISTFLKLAVSHGLMRNFLYD